MDSLLPQALRADPDKLSSMSTDPDFVGSANRFREELGRARQIYSRLFFEPDSAHRSPSELMLAQYFISKRDWAQSALQLYTSARNTRTSIKRLSFGPELIGELQSLNEIVDFLTERKTVEEQSSNAALLKMHDDLFKEANGLVQRVRKAAGVTHGAELPGDNVKASGGLTSQRILSADEVRLMLGNIVMTAESVAKSADSLVVQQN